tara:strand:- start:1616 stop:1939 length:324 start_codon:yes stop_codon:yes gene_type:complete
MKLLRIVRSSNSAKKYDAIFMIDNKEKKVSFGASGYRDYTLINNKNSKFYLPKILDRNVVRSSYIRRHEKKENWNNPLTAGALSRFILWNKKTLNSSIRDFKKKFKV